MEKDTVRNWIINLGRSDFKKVISLVLSKIFNFIPSDVDGTGDGGSDWLIFSQLGEQLAVGIQDTTQSSGFRKKAVEDAIKAKDKLGIRRYFFITNRSHSRTTMHKLQAKIIAEAKIAATCFSANELAGLILENNLTGDFFDIIDVPKAAGSSTRADRNEMLLHAFSFMGTETRDLRNSVFDDALLIECKKGEGIDRETLISNTIQTMGFDSNKKTFLNGRVDSLLTRGALVPNEKKEIYLSPDKEQELENSERVYLHEFAGLSSAQSALMESNYGIYWTPSHAERASLLLSRMFIKSQLDNVKNARVSFTSVGLFKNLGDPFVELREYLLESGLPAEKLDDAVAELVDQAKDLPIVKNLSRIAIFIALEGSSLLASAKSLGASNWNEIIVSLDTSAALPILCSSLYVPSDNRFYLDSLNVKNRLQKLGSKLTISHYYNTECASHLLQALSYNELDMYADALTLSQNGFVSHYFTLKSRNLKVPDSLIEYLSYFSEAILRRDEDTQRWTRKIMVELQRLFAQYDIEFEFVEKLSNAYLTDYQTDYTYILQQKGDSRPDHLIKHDVFTLGHAKRNIAEKGEHRMILTWDKAMIKIGQKHSDCGWVVSPDIACDFLNPFLPAEEHICAIAHSLAKAGNKSLEITARIIDKVVTLASDKIMDWEFQKKLEEFRGSMINAIEENQSSDLNWIDNETIKFLTEEGLISSEEDSGEKK